MILIDIGNSRLKWAIQTHSGWLPQTALNYRTDNFLDQLHTGWSNLPPVEQLALASVSQPALTRQIINLAKQHWPDIKITIAHSNRAQHGVKNAYQIPEKLGVDRWLALLAAHHCYANDCWVIDCGTAITLDYLKADGQHTGGLICPGLDLMKHSLQRAEQLPLTTQNYVMDVADFTEAGIYSGTLMAACGLIEHATQQYPADTLILTGGDASLIAQHLNIETCLEPDLVLKGLALYCEK